MSNPEPLHCPYCGEEDLRPYEAQRGWSCASCARTFTVSLLGIGVAR